ncbi:UNVERIFIED_CONTAM: hypothetical protein GTU68_009243 [Idotea baltica]|nr:hypothetical protein [Idotea baltica]
MMAAPTYLYIFQQFRRLDCRNCRTICVCLLKQNRTNAAKAQRPLTFRWKVNSLKNSARLI